MVYNVENEGEMKRLANAFLEPRGFSARLEKALSLPLPPTWELLLTYCIPLLPWHKIFGGSLTLNQFHPRGLVARTIRFC